MLPERAGLGLRDPFLDQILDERPEIAWLEVHTENFFAAPRLDVLCRIRETYPVSLHGVALGLGNARGPDSVLLEQLRALVKIVEPEIVSEHCSWNRGQQGVLHDLLPMPPVRAALERMVASVHQVQEVLGRVIAVENVSRYLSCQQLQEGWPSEEWLTEAELLSELVRRTDCLLLLDVNNIEVNRLNHQENPYRVLDHLPLSSVAEVHIAGYSEEPGGRFVDTHGSAVSEPVWELLQYLLERIGPRPVLLERDTDIPALEILLQEVDRADRLLRSA